MLEVVQHHQQAPLGQPGLEQVADRAAGGQRHGQGLGHGHGQQVGHLLGVVRLDPGQGDHGGAVGEPGGQPLGRGQGEPGLADPTRPDQRQQPAGLPLDQRDHPGQVGLPPDQVGGVDNREHLVAHSATLPLRGAKPRRGGFRHAWIGTGGGEVAGADAVGEADRLRGGVDSQLLGQHVAAGLELGQGGRPVVLGGQEPHQQPVRLLRQRVERQHPAGRLDPGGRVAAGGGVVGQPGQPGHGQPAQVLALALDPGLELGGAPHDQVVEEVAPVQPDGRLDPLQVAVPAGQGGRELAPVEPEAGRVGGHVAARHLEVVVDHPAQLGQGQAQVGPGALLGQVAPEQPGKGRPRVPLARRGQVQQQRGRLGRAQLDRRAVVAGDPGLAQDGDPEPWQPSTCPSCASGEA